MMKFYPIYRIIAYTFVNTCKLGYNNEKVRHYTEKSPFQLLVVGLGI